MSKLLTQCKPGKVYSVSGLKGNEETNHFLTNIGLHVGDEIAIIGKFPPNYIINVKDGRFGIDSGMAKLIEVEE